MNKNIFFALSFLALATTTNAYAGGYSEIDYNDDGSVTLHDPWVKFNGEKGCIENESDLRGACKLFGFARGLKGGTAKNTSDRIANYAYVIGPHGHLSYSANVVENEAHYACLVGKTKVDNSNCPENHNFYNCISQLNCSK